MFYFGVLMATTLWLRNLLGDDRWTIGVTLLSVWGISWFIRRRRKQARPARPSPAARPVEGTVLQPALARAASVSAQSEASIRLQPPRSAPPTSAAIRKRAGRKRRPH